MAGAGIPAHVRPPSVVRSTEVHTGRGHGAVPSTQPRCDEMKVTDCGWNPAGTGPPGGPPRVVDVVELEVVDEPVVDVDDELVVVERDRGAG